MKGASTGAAGAESVPPVPAERQGLTPRHPSVG